MRDHDNVEMGDSGGQVVAHATLAGLRTLDGERLIAVLAALVEPIGRSLPVSSEVLLHDLSLLPNSIVAAYGELTHRRAGDPATDLLLEQAVSGFRDVLGYRTRLKDGRWMRSSTMIIRDVFDNPVAALCINTDLTAWSSLAAIASNMLGIRLDLEANTASPPTPETQEAFVTSIDDLATELISRAVENVGISVDLMRKEHKLEVVRELKSRGLFLIREAVEMVAEALDVTRFTIYNYLNELAESDGDSTRGPRRSSKRGEEAR